MNPDDMRALFDEALDGADPVPSSSTDDIVTAGRRRVSRRRAAIGASAIAGVAVLAAAAVLPMALSGEAPFDAAWQGDEEVNDCEAPDDQSDAQRAVAAMYDQALTTAFTDVGGTLGGYCG